MLGEWVRFCDYRKRRHYEPVVPVSLPSSALAAASSAVIHPRIALIRINTVGLCGEHPAGPLIIMPISAAGDMLLATSGPPLAPTQPPVLYDGGSMAQRSYFASKFHTFALHHPDVWTNVGAITFSGCENCASKTARGRRSPVAQPTISARGAPGQLSPEAREIGVSVVAVLMTSNAASHDEQCGISTSRRKPRSAQIR